MRSRYSICILLVVMSITVAAWAVDGSAETTATPAARSSEAVAERIFQQEARLVDNMHNYTPLVETYIQRLKPDADLGTERGKSRNFRGRLERGQRGVQKTAF